MGIAGWLDRLAPLVRGTSRALSGPLLDLIYPEKCVLCGAEPGEKPWCQTGPVVAGLRWFDVPHLCLPCAALISPAPVRGLVGEEQLAIHGGRHPNGDLVLALGQWKYHGARGLAWPLADLLGSAVGAAIARDGPVDRLVPVALHGRRRRTRGFNQAEVLARLAGQKHGVPVSAGLLRRTRNTGQQAKLEEGEARMANMAGAFAVKCSLEAGRECRIEGSGGLRIGLVDDLVTSGATCAAAASALTAGGWQVCWAAALGVAVAAG